MGRTEDAFDPGAVFGSAGTALVRNGHGPLQPALDPVHPAARVFFPIRSCSISCTRVKKCTSIRYGCGADTGQRGCTGVGIGVGIGVGVGCSEGVEVKAGSGVGVAVTVGC